MKLMGLLVLVCMIRFDGAARVDNIQEYSAPKIHAD